MATWNSGSVAEEVLKLIPDVPTNLSGAQLINIVERQIYFAEEYTGTTIGTTNIPTRFQPAIVSLSAAEVLSFMTLLGADSRSFSLGDLSISKGVGDPLHSASLYFRETGMAQLKDVQQSFNFYKALG